MIEILRKYIVVPVALLGLSIAFIILSIALSAAKGKDSILRKKLRIGGLILAMQGLTAQGVWPSAGCYVPAPPECTVELGSSEQAVELNLEESNTVEATIHYGDQQLFTFAVVADNSVVQSGIVVPIDQRMDSPEEKVTISIDPNKVASGRQYQLHILQGQYEEEASIIVAIVADSSDVIASFPLIVRGQ
jgi:hypothetical protein